MRVYEYICPTGDAYQNLATEALIMEQLPSDAVCLMLYVNSSAVIIGQNQNPLHECDIGAMQRDGVQLVRRMTGGGAVFHDSGNLNFSFLCPAAIYDEAQQTQLIFDALMHFGIKATVDGRNDLILDGRKFSGNAYLKRGDRQLRHGTLLVDCDMKKMECYLRVPPKKLQAKGVASVRSRVCNLTMVAPELTVADLQDAILYSYRTAYPQATPYVLSQAGQGRILQKADEMRSLFSQMRDTPPFTLTVEERFGFGTAELCFRVENGMVTDCRVYTDSLDLSVAPFLARCLSGIPFTPDGVRSALGTEYCEVAKRLQMEF